jgi:hypothetical protein
VLVGLLIANLAFRFYRKAWIPLTKRINELLQEVKSVSEGNHLANDHNVGELLREVTVLERIRTAISFK